MATRGDRDQASGGGRRSIHAVRPDVFKYVWDNSIEPELEVDSGEVVEFRLRDVSDEQLTADSTSEDAPNRAVGAFLPDEIFTGGGDR